ncbi:hypothetical protein ASG36_16125 [Geodermatophilus sp. Leaf369]|uniref:hypothetical protein n=1 Tax=Geodermatophilus sp. Leaf369 TaxID=1736354 RepID=UPI0006F55B2C|nr:hypothetical protein [Geodermatophilus sp. Leaf369]KQS58062.1 hypothetical protein ASG36_16125 [Geodermatophilus sp. Leaf369]
MTTRVTAGRAGLVREIRATAPLTVRGPVTARGPWLTTAAQASSARLHGVLVESHQQGRPRGAALLSSRRRGPVTTVRLLGDGDLPDPAGAPPRRLPVVDHGAAEELADGVVGLLESLPGRWSLRLTGLPLGDPALSALARRLGTGAHFRTERARTLVDRLDDLGAVHRSQDPVDLERWLPAFLDRRPPGVGLGPVRAAARVHAGLGGLEHAVVVRGGRAVAGLLTLVGDGPRRPWWGWTETGGLDSGPGQPSVSLTAASWSVSRGRGRG